MIICIPAMSNDGLASPVSGHFGSAPNFFLYDTEKDSFQHIQNDPSNHDHGSCIPVTSLIQNSVDAVCTAGMGRRALMHLSENNIKVYALEGTTVGEVIDAYKAASLKEFSADDACAGHH